MTGYDYTEGHEAIYEALLSSDEVLTILRNIYEEQHLPNLSTSWHIINHEEKPQWHYVLDVDYDHFLLEEYNDAPAMIQKALNGVKQKEYHQINIRTHDFLGPSYFIFPGNKEYLFRVQLLLKETPRKMTDKNGRITDIPGNTYLLESYFNNEVSLNYWIQKTINTLEIPDVSEWKRLAVPKDLSF